MSAVPLAAQWRATWLFVAGQTDAGLRVLLDAFDFQPRGSCDEVQIETLASKVYRAKVLGVATFTSGLPYAKLKLGMPLK